MNTQTPPQLDPNQPKYHSYLLRLWETPQGWHASLDDPHTGKRLGFASPEQLFAHLMELTERHAGSDRP